MAVETVSSLLFTGPLTWTADAACAGQTELFFAPAGERPETRLLREARARADLPRAARSSTRAATGLARTASTASGAASPKRSAPPPASGSTCRSAASPATRRATASPVEPREPARRLTPRLERSARPASERPDASPTPRHRKVSISSALASVVRRRTSRAPATRRSRAELIAGGRSNLTYSVTDGAHDVGAAPPAARPRRRDRARHGSRVPRASPRSQDSDVPVPARRRALRRPRRHRRAVLRDGARRRPGPAHPRRAGRRSTPDDARRVSARAGRRARAAARRRLRGGRPRRASAGPTASSPATSPGGASSGRRTRRASCPQIDELARRLDAALPESGPPAIVHGDYRLDNTMLAPDDPDDRRRARLGDVDARRPAHRPRPVPRVLGALGTTADRGPLAHRRSPRACPASSASTRSSRATPSESRPRPVEHLDFYVVFAFYKLAVILEGINARFLMGKTLGEGFTRWARWWCSSRSARSPSPTGPRIPRCGAETVVAADDRWLRVTPSCRIDRSELTWRVSRSGGPGGQHANTSDTRVEVVFDVTTSPSLGPRQRARLLDRVGPVVRATAADSRSQARNRELALERLRARLTRGLAVEPRRKPTRVVTRRPRTTSRREAAAQPAEAATPPPGHGRLRGVPRLVTRGG